MPRTFLLFWTFVFPTKEHRHHTCLNFRALRTFSFWTQKLIFGKQRGNKWTSKEWDGDSGGTLGHVLLPQQLQTDPRRAAPLQTPRRCTLTVLLLSARRWWSVTLYRCSGWTSLYIWHWDTFPELYWQHRMTGRNVCLLYSPPYALVEVLLKVFPGEIVRDGTFNSKYSSTMLLLDLNVMG